ncbi:transposase [Paenibacillus lautus]
MLTKVNVYAYTQRIYSSRQIANAVRENVMFMWIAGRQHPYFRTTNRFRSERIKDVLEKIFMSVLQFRPGEGPDLYSNWRRNCNPGPRTNH